MPSSTLMWSITGASSGFGHAFATVRSIDKLRSRWPVQPDRLMFAKLNLTRRNDGNTPKQSCQDSVNKKQDSFRSFQFPPWFPNGNQCKEPESSALEFPTLLIQWAKKPRQVFNGGRFFERSIFRLGCFFPKITLSAQHKPFETLQASLAWLLRKRF